MELPDDIRRLRSAILTEIYRKIEGCISSIQRDKMKYTCTGYKLCNGCENRKLVETKKCGTYGLKEFRDAVCNDSNRLLWFMKWLEFCQYWPFSDHAGRNCRSFGNEAHIHSERSSYSPFQFSWAHSCEGKSGCPLEAAKIEVTASTYATRVLIWLGQSEILRAPRMHSIF
jgi:hypothetical protein